MNLYELSSAFEKAVLAYQAAESDEEMDKALAACFELEGKRDKKYADCCAFLKNLSGLIDMVGAEIGQLKEKERRLKSLAERFKEYMERSIPNTEKWSNGVHSIGWRASESVEILDENEVPEQYMTIKTVMTPDKVTIKKDLKYGALIPGVDLVTKRNIQVK